MKTDLFDYELPDTAIATIPIMPRERARLLRVAGNALSHHHLGDLPTLLRAGDLMIFNDSRVIPARLIGIRERHVTDASDPSIKTKIDITLHKPISDITDNKNDRRSLALHAQNLGADDTHMSPFHLIAKMPENWRVFARPGKKLRAGDVLRFADDFYATIQAKLDNGELIIGFNHSGDKLRAALHQYGTMPLPPYLRRAATPQDHHDYQTIFAKSEGSVAAPTAGLHISPELLTALGQAGIDHDYVTLHVGAGTFQPVKTEEIDQHIMHSEAGFISEDVAARINSAKSQGRRIIACGTTALRVLEAATSPDGVVYPFASETSIFITPGYRFRCVNGLLTNFHLPRSSLLMLVAAFIGLDQVRETYRVAIASGYRFYSYGDASLLLPDKENP